MRPNNGALRYFGRIKNGATPASGEVEYWDGDVLWATPEDLGKLSGDRISQTRRRVTQKAVDESNLSVLPAGSVIISTRAPIGHMALNNMPMTFNQGCRGIIPGDRVHGPYLYYLLKSRAPELNAMANGTTFVELSRDELAAVPVEFPPLDTQRRIVRLLDEKTARIDGLIARKERLLDLLAEKRQALITRAVTKGLDPDAPMKPSGIGWLGDIPAHWEVKRLRFLTKMASGATPPTAEPSYWDGGIPWVCPKDMKTDHVSTSLVTVSQVAIDKHGLRRFNEPHVVIVTRGMILARRVPVAVASGGFTINQDMRVLTTQGRVIPSYLQMYLSAIGNYLLTLVGEAGHGTKALRTDVLMDTPVLVPPLEEQTILTAEVKKAAQGHEGTTANIGRSIETLKEYRSALITAAVIGQLDVTEEAV